MVICKECGGDGKFIIHNAYKPTFKKEVTCEYCAGAGVVKSLDKKDNVIN